LRPFELDSLFRSITVLPGVGPKSAKLFEKLTGGKVLDVLFHKPVDFVDRRFSPVLKDAPDGKICTLEIRIEKHNFAPRRGIPSRVKAHDSTGQIDLVFFNANKDWIAKQLPIGETRIVSGKVEHYQGAIQMVHPDAIVTTDERASVETVEPIYPLTAGVTNKTMRKAIEGALKFAPDLNEWLDPAYKKKNKLPDWQDAINTLHDFDNESALDPNHPARVRLAYDELLANQLSLALVRLHQRKQNGRSWNVNNPYREKILNHLPFELTGAQKRCLDDIDTDMAEPLRMLRLVQGDVGGCFLCDIDRA